MDWTNSDIGDEHLIPPSAWSPDGRMLYVLASQRGASRVYAIPGTGASPQPQTLTPGDVHVRDFTADPSASKMAMLIANATHPQEVYVRSTDPSGELRRITGFNDALLNELDLVAPEYMQYTGAFKLARQAGSRVIHCSR